MSTSPTKMWNQILKYTEPDIGMENNVSGSILGRHKIFFINFIMNTIPVY